MRYELTAHEWVAIKSRERFGKLQRVWLAFVEAHLGCDALFDLLRETFEMLFGRRREEKLHTWLYAEPFKNLLLWCSIAAAHFSLCTLKIPSKFCVRNEIFLDGLQRLQR